MSGAQTLFSDGLPSLDNVTTYSFAWTGHIKHDDTIKILSMFDEVKTIEDLDRMVNEIGEYRSIP